ncbi:MAG: ROK family protein [Cellulosilyticaceae bacterium]
MRILAIDIGGTMLKIAETTEDGTIISSYEEPSQAKKGGPYLMEKVCNLIASYKEYDCIGISTAGQVDSEKGEIIYANENIPNYTGMKVVEMLQSRFKVPVVVENDVNAAALGEAIYGAARYEKDFLCLTYGTGIGGAIVMDRKIYKGARGIAGEFGHIVTHPEGLLCGCGHKGCYEQYASTTALLRLASERDGTCTDGRILFRKFNEGNGDMKEVLDSWLDEILIGLTTLIHIFNPSCVLLGGGILEQPYIIETINQRIHHHIMSSYGDVKIRNTELGNRAGLLGASYLATQLMR